MYDLVIIGGGPAGAAAGVYAARKKIKTVLITENFGGQSVVSIEVQNWIGEKSISGLELARKLEEHVRTHKIDIEESDMVERVEKISGGFKVFSKNGKQFETKSILAASGSRRKKLGVPGEKEFGGKGVAYCATCDAPLFTGKTVAVIGAGNVGLEAARDLTSYAKKIYLLVRSEKIRGDIVTLEEISKNGYVLTPGRYVGIPEEIDDGIPFEIKMKQYSDDLNKYFEEGKKLEDEIKNNLKKINL